MTTTNNTEIDWKLSIKLSNKGYVTAPAEAIKELFHFASECAASDDAALKSSSERLIRGLSEFAKALDTIRESDQDRYFAGLLS